MKLRSVEASAIGLRLMEIPKQDLAKLVMMLHTLHDNICKHANHTGRGAEFGFWDAPVDEAAKEGLEKAKAGHEHSASLVATLINLLQEAAQP